MATVDEFPMTVTGKVQKYKLREMAIEQLGLEDAAAIETAERAVTMAITTSAKHTAMTPWIPVTARCGRSPRTFERSGQRLRHAGGKPR